MMSKSKIENMMSKSKAKGELKTTAKEFTKAVLEYIALVIYYRASWGFVTYQFLIWFGPILDLPVVSYVQAIALTYLSILLKPGTGQIVKKEYLTEHIKTIKVVYPWVALAGAWAFQAMFL
tara:strand:+ start:56 stop:418 length:363 start_codon:yes stop_codon:yes gene_type:complete